MHENGCFSFGIKGKHSDCRAVIFDLSLDELSVGQANGNNRETSPPLVLGLDTYDFTFHVEHRKRLPFGRDECYDGALLRNSAMTPIASRIGWSP